MIIEKTHYNLKKEYQEDLSKLLDKILNDFQVIQNRSIPKENNEYYTSLEFLNEVKEHHKIKKSTYVNSDCQSKCKTVSNLSAETSDAFLKCLSSFVSERSNFPASACALTGNIVYPKNGYMGWHNNVRIGWRLYCTYCNEDAKSYFRYEDDNGEIIDCLEKKGWNFRFFYIRDTFSPLWHSIYTETERVALGIFLGLDLIKIQNLIGEIK